MEYTISFLTLAVLVFNIILGMVIPSFLFAYCHRNYHGISKAFWTGMATVIFFVYFMESALHNMILPTRIGQVIEGNVFLSAIYGAVLAVIFQEGGKWFAFKKLMPNDLENDGNALMYAVGHGSFEWMYGLIFGMLGNFMLARNVYSGNADAILYGLDGEALTTAAESLKAFCTASPMTFLLAPLERLVAFSIQISVTVLMWFGIQAGKNGNRYVLEAMAVRFGVELLAGILGGYLSVFKTEMVMLVVAVFVAMHAVQIWQKEAVVWEPDEI